MIVLPTYGPRSIAMATCLSDFYAHYPKVNVSQTVTSQISTKRNDSVVNKHGFPRLGFGLNEESGMVERQLSKRCMS
jgi:hypothetical protein